MNEIFITSKLIGQELNSTVTVPKKLRKYFHSSRLSAYYHTQLTANKSILNVPLVSTVLPLAWLTGTDVHVEKLDKKYVEAINIIKNEFNRMFPRGRFTTKIIVDDLVENRTQSQGIAMLFTGGVDSTYSLIRNISLKPRLLMFQGILSHQLDPHFKKYNQIVKKTYSDFAKREGLDINFVEANTFHILNHSRLEHDFHKTLRGTTLWLGLQFPLVLLSLPAPLSIGRFNRLLIAASADPTHDYYKHPESSQPKIDEKFAWADLRVKHDGFIHRFSKTSLIREYLKKHEYYLTVCNDPPPDRLNCSNCEKCYRTIAPLILEGIDPNNCGFEVNRSTFKLMRYLLEKKKFGALVVDSIWKVLPTLIPDKMETNLYGSRDFFIWLRNLKFDSRQKKRNLHRDLFNSLPYPLAKLFDAICYSVRNQSFDPIFTLRQELIKRRLQRSI